MPIVFKYASMSSFRFKPCNIERRPARFQNKGNKETKAVESPLGADQYRDKDEGNLCTIVCYDCRGCNKPLLSFSCTPVGVVSKPVLTTRVRKTIRQDRVRCQTTAQRSYLSVRSICTSSGGDLRLPLVTVGEQLLLVVQEFLTSLGGVLGIWGCRRTLVRYQIRFAGHTKLTLNNSVHRAALLAVTAVNALGHVDIVTGRPTTSILTLLRLNSNSLGRADGLAELAGNAALFAGGIAAQSVLTTKAGRDGTLLERIKDSVSVTLKSGLSVYLGLFEIANRQDRICIARRSTYGGRKYCSSTTYIPRNSSAMRKYLLALSSEDSEPWSQRFGGGRRKPG